MNRPQFTPVEGLITPSRSRVYLLDRTAECEVLILAGPSPQSPPYTLSSADLSLPGLSAQPGRKWFRISAWGKNPLLRLQERKLTGQYALWLFLDERCDDEFYGSTTLVILPGGLSMREEKEALSNYLLRVGRVIFPDEIEEKKGKALRFTTLGGLVLWVLS